MLSIFSVLSDVQSDTNCPIPRLTIFTQLAYVACAPAKLLCEAN